MYSAAEIRSRLGISTVAFAGMEGLEWARAEQAAGLGIRKIELAAQAEPTHFPFAHRAAVRELEKRFRDMGLEVYAIHAPRHNWPLGPGEMTQAREFLDAADRLRPTLLVLEFDLRGRRGWNEAMDALHRLMDEAQHRGIRLSLEAGIEISTAILLADFFRFPDVGVTLDIGDASAAYPGINLFANPEAARMILRLGWGKLNHIHLSDACESPRDFPGHPEPHRLRTHLAPFTGSTRWDAVMKSLTQMEYEGSFMFEVFGDDPQALEHVARFPERMAEIATDGPGEASG